MIAREQALIDQVTAQACVIAVDPTEDEVHVRFGVVASGLEEAGEVREQRGAIGGARRDRLEAIASEKSRELRRTRELLAPSHVARDPFHAGEYLGCVP